MLVIVKVSDGKIGNFQFKSLLLMKTLTTFKKEISSVLQFISF